MLSYLFDIIFLLVAIGVGYKISRNSFVHCAALLVGMLIASLLAITNFEPVAEFIRANYLAPSDFRVAMHLYFVVCITIFVASLATSWWAITAILPEAPEMSRRAEAVGRWVCGAAGGYLFASFLLTALLTFPAPRDFGGAFPPEQILRTSPVTFFAPDYQFLTLTDYTCDAAFALTGGRWLLGRPAISASLDRGRWASFPIRYALWRQQFGRFWFPSADQDSR